MSPTTPTAMPPSCSPSWAVVFVSCPIFALPECPADPLAVYIFVGSILLHDNVLRIIAASLVGLTGVGYVALEFIPSIEPPSNMRESDQGWGAEQV